MILLHGTFIDEFLIEIVLPLSIFGGLYWWSSRKERKKRSALPPDAVKVAAVAPDATDGRVDK